MRFAIPDRTPLSGLLAAALLAGGCGLTRVDPQNETIRHPFYGLEEFQPADLAVVPVEDRSEDGTAPVATLRRMLYAGVADHLYSPIDLDFVDKHWVEAGFSADSLEAGGLLRVVIREWDRTLLATHGAIRVTLTAEVVDGARPDGDPLWGVTLERRIELAFDKVRLTERDLYDRAAEILAAEILRELPTRDPVPVDLR